MNEFRDLPFAQRLHVLGDEAEAVFEAVHPLGPVERFGWKRPKISMKKMPAMLRHKPDYYCEVGALVEVVGCGRDGILKAIKPEKYLALREWKKFCDKLGIQFAVFVWNSHAEKFVLLDWIGLVKLVGKARRRGVEKFNDGNEYYAILWEEVLQEASWVGTWTTQ